MLLVYLFFCVAVLINTQLCLFAKMLYDVCKKADKYLDIKMNLLSKFSIYNGYRLYM